MFVSVEFQFVLSQDILENESINLDWMFRYSLINDIVKVCETTEKLYKCAYRTYISPIRSQIF